MLPRFENILDQIKGAVCTLDASVKMYRTVRVGAFRSVSKRFEVFGKAADNQI